MKVLVAGSHGLIGSSLVEALISRGDHVVRLVRSRRSADGEIRWDLHSQSIDLELMEGFDAVVHLGGVSIGERRWSEREKELLWNSRIVSTDILAQALAKVIVRPATFVCASAVGYYGDRGDEVLTEKASSGEGFLAALCKEWEAATATAAQVGIRTVNLRSGVVLSPLGGALARQLPLFRLGLGGRLGPGTQWLPWITLDDEVAAILHALDTPSLAGPVNLTSPNPVTNAQYTSMLGEQLRRLTLVPSPRWMLKVALGEQLTDEVLLASQRVRPSKLLASGFSFQHADLADALAHLLRRPSGEQDESSDDTSSKKKHKKNKK